MIVLIGILELSIVSTAENASKICPPKLLIDKYISAGEFFVTNELCYKSLFNTSIVLFNFNIFVLSISA